MTPKAKKDPRTLAGFHGGNGGEPNRNILPRRPRKSKRIQIAAPLFMGAAFALFFMPAALIIALALVEALR
ncbi:MAG: hypothetical protein JJU29_12600 [Verrucomicrobia bacterium]|nr:hypothetical protein [Verrucomicrobiota bacterium]MCH8510846.1 hypothetical protein [Kiritimatiellia bacterium]